MSSTESVTDGGYIYKIPSALGCYNYAKNASKYVDNDIEWPSGIVCGYTKDKNDKAIAEVKITAIRISTGEYNLEDYCFSFKSDNAGQYMQVLPQGTYDFVISKDGYLPYAIQNIVVKPNETMYMENIIMDKWVSIAYDTGCINGTVVHALSGEKVSGATVKIHKGWNNRTGEYCKSLLGDIKMATTSLDGEFSIDASVGTYTVEISKKGYITAYYNVVSNDMDTAYTKIVLTPSLSNDEYRIVLTWDANPRDLDSHLTYYVAQEQKCHVSYRNKKGEYAGNIIASLDLDDISSYGPETITITLDTSLLEEGSEFRYSVHDYSSKSSTTSKALSLSNATVHVYEGNKLINKYCVPQNNIGTVWHVFDITIDGIHMVNEFYNATTASGVY